jgi:hypothetical protein
LKIKEMNPKLEVKSFNRLANLDAY